MRPSKNRTVFSYQSRTHSADCGVDGLDPRQPATKPLCRKLGGGNCDPGSKSSAYQRPPDCLFVREVGEGEGCAWAVESGTLLTNEGAPLNLTYTRAVTNPAAFDPLFAETLAARIAAEIAVSLTESLGKAQALWQVYQQKLAEARRRDAQEGLRQCANDGNWIGAR